MSEHSQALQQGKRPAAKKRVLLIRQVFAFGLVGVLNTAVDFLVFMILTHFLAVFYMIAQIFSYGAGMLNSYVLNSKVTFSSSLKSGTRFIKFVILNISVLVITLIVMHNLTFLPLYINKLISTVVGLAFNFVLSKLWVFKA
ncbi:GtrA family protein [Sporolactobacillus shoreae]|uniref:GtrA family protein n=1 Tax=Sporolactobacillus shoreae TaxID=1465501 RepID=A0A4Z0GRS8_9BACL|nr:GtrA family protein [Sporolactobacillus shoreae]TGB00124.1 GtrA family protein [Sporolactobacillus shoreae]